MNVGSSINFDGKAFVDQQEAELEQEEKNREQELRELLTNALPDDLLEDDEDDYESGSSSDASSLSSQEDEEADDKRPLPWKTKVQENQKTSTPHSRSPPPLETPATGIGGRGRGNEIRSNVHKNNGNGHFQQEDKSYGLQPPPERKSVSPHSSDDQQYAGSRREAEGSEYVTDQHQGIPRTSTSYQPHVYYPNQGPYYENRPRQDMNPQVVKPGPGDMNWDQAHLENRRESQQYEPSERKAGPDSYPSKGLDNNGSLAPSVGQNTEINVYPVQDNAGTPKIHYTGGKNGLGQRDRVAMEAEQGERYPAMGRTASVDLLMAQEYENLQGHYLHAGATSSGQQYAQMQILYQARGRELEQLTGQLRMLQEESAREKRILNHQLALAQGEKNGLSTSYEQTKHLLASSKDENLKLEGHYQAATAQIQALTAARDEIMKKLQTTETKVETMTKELTEIQKSQPLARAREHQDTVLAEMQRKHEEEITDLQGRLQRVISDLEEKEALSNRFQCQLEEHQRSLQQNQIQHGETVNRLTAQLEESQRRCGDLLGQGSYQEANSLHQQLQVAQNAKQMSENLCKSMQEEVTDLKQQLLAIESAVRLGALSPHSSPEGQGDNVVRNLAKEDWSTPKPGGTDVGFPNDQVIQGLKKELERSLLNNKRKRNQVATLQDEVQALKRQINEWKERAEKAEKIHQEQAAASNSGMVSEVKRLQEDIRTMDEEINKLRDSESKLRAENSELKQRMTDMVMENDEDKRKAVERCQNTCMQLHEDSSRNLREEMVAQWQAEKETLEDNHKKLLAQLKKDNEKTMEELDKVKQLYLRVCEEKNGIEDQLKEKIRGDFNKKLLELKEKCDADKETALNDQRLSLENIHKGKLMAMKAEKETEYQDRLNDQLELAKIEWSNSLGKQMAQEAVQKCNRDWEEKIDEEVNKRLQDGDVVNTSVQTADDIARDNGSREEIENLNQEIVQLQMELKQQAVALRTKETLYESKLSSLKQEQEEKMEEVEREHEKNLEQRLTQARNLWEGIQKHRESKHAKNLKLLTEQWIEEKKRLEEQQEQEVKQKADEAVRDSEAIMRKMFDSEITSIKEGVKNKEHSWIREKELLKTQLGRAQEELTSLQSNLQRQAEDQSQGSDQEMSELRGKLCRLEQEKQQLEDKLNRELQYMKTRMKEANALTAESLESRLSDLQRARQRDRTSSTRSSSDGMRQSGSGTDVEESTAQTDNHHQGSHANCMVELKNQYLNTVTQIRVDVMQYIKEVREHCQQTVRMEVEKARNSTSKRLREHFTLCLKDQLEEDKKRARNDKRRQSATFMLGALNRFMETKLDGEGSDTYDSCPDTGHEAVGSLEGDLTGDTPYPRQESLEVNQTSSRRGRTMSVQFSDNLGKMDNLLDGEERGKEPLVKPVRGKEPSVKPVTLFPDHLITQDDEELLQRTFDRLSILDGSSDVDSVMRSDSPSGEFHSLEEVSLSPSHSSSELEEIIKKNSLEGLLGSPSAHEAISNKQSDRRSRDPRTAPSKSKLRSTDTRNHDRSFNNITVRSRTRTSGVVQDVTQRQTRTKPQSDRVERSRDERSNNDHHDRSGGQRSKPDSDRHRVEADAMVSSQFVPLSRRKDIGSQSKVDRRTPAKEIRRPVPVTAGQYQSFIPNSNVNLSATSVTTEYNDLPDNL
ncbi:uncharacterized protein [Apostichopus japonicus]|uniref:uncharacterized protein isoform X2 n=1 Tax=Stichopus japonicus TaxID=307972 RepID=UPI003AB21D4F